MVSKEEFVKILNLPQPSEEVLFRLEVCYGFAPTPPETDSDRRECDYLRVAYTLRWLCFRVDDWLSTGRGADGSESPFRRDVSRTRYALAPEHAILKGVPFPVAVSGLTTDLPHGSRDWSLFFMECIATADKYFAELMMSDWKHSLSRCQYDRCGRYFLRKTVRQSYRHGAFCGRQHQALESARACTDNRRKRARDKLVDFAARRLVEWRIDNARWQDHVPLKRRLAAALSQLIARDPNLAGDRDKVTVNWVTRHWRGIERKRSELAVDRGRMGRDGASKPSEAPSASPS